MNQVWRLVAKEWRLFFADRVAVALTFFVPVILTIIFGAVFGGASKGPRGIKMALVNESHSPIATGIEKSLDTMTSIRLIRTHKIDSGMEIAFDTNSVKEFVRRGDATAALVLPADLISDTAIGIKLKFYYDPKNNIEMQMLEGIVQQTVYRQLPKIFSQTMQRSAERVLGVDSGKVFNQKIASLVSKYFKIDSSRVLHPFAFPDSTGSDTVDSGAGNFFGKIIRLNKEQLVGKEIKSPWATQSVGGWAIMFLLFSLTASASSLFDEKKAGIVLRLLASPISRSQILWSKYVFNMSLGIIQLMFLFIVGWMLYDINIFLHWFDLLLIIFSAATACTAFGMLLAAFSKTEQQARGLGTLLILTMSSIGGAWFPTSFMPDYILYFSKLTLVYWAMDGFLQVLWRGAGTFAILPNVGILLGIAVTLNIVSYFQFKKGHVF